jgi:hypothetical protein
MGKVEDIITRQRNEQAVRILRNFPDECAAAKERFCSLCMFELKVKHECEHGLAPITSAKLPCPYYRY